jgi:hypothetical protein
MCGGVVVVLPKRTPLVFWKYHSRGYHQDAAMSSVSCTADELLQKTERLSMGMQILCVLPPSVYDGMC